MPINEQECVGGQGWVLAHAPPAEEVLRLEWNPHPPSIPAPVYFIPLVAARSLRAPRHLGRQCPEGRAECLPGPRQPWVSISKGRAGLHKQGLVSQGWGAGAVQAKAGLSTCHTRPCLPLGPRQLEDLLPHGEQPLPLVLEANVCGLHGPHAQLPLAAPMQELDTGVGAVRSHRAPLPRPALPLPTCSVLMQARMSLSVFSQRAASAPGSACMPCRREIDLKQRWQNTSGGKTVFLIAVYF